jgi:peptidoglycan/xylan/chitin deacetylase (PgdA/CDA1 family)
MKHHVLSAVARVGGFALCRRAHRRQALVLTYHRFSRDPANPDAISAGAFAEQLEYLTTRYRIVPLAWLVDRLRSRQSLPSGLAAITVDDGYESVYEVAFPLLRQFDVPATVFAVTGFLDGTCWIWTDSVRYLLAQTHAGRIDLDLGGHRLCTRFETPNERRAVAAHVNVVLKTLSNDAKDEALQCMSEQLDVPLPPDPPSDMRPISWQQAREMATAGIDIGSHTVTHPVLTRVSDPQLAREVGESRARMEQMLPGRVTLFCYPNGGIDARVRAAVARAGYHGAVTTVPGFNTDSCDPLAMRRIHTEGDLPHFIQSTSGFELLKSRLRPSRSWPFQPD